jgi:hypothetical protein
MTAELEAFGKYFAALAVEFVFSIMALCSAMLYPAECGSFTSIVMISYQHLPHGDPTVHCHCPLWSQQLHSCHKNRCFGWV